VKELYPASLAVVVMVVLADKLVAVVVSAGCKIVDGVVMMISISIVTTRPLWQQY